MANPANATREASTGLLIGIFIALMVLFGLQIVLAKLPLGHLEWVAAYIVATAKALLVILFFMHVRYSGHTSWVFAGAAFLWLGIMFTLTYSDYLTRGWTPEAEVISPATSPRVPPIVPTQGWAR